VRYFIMRARKGATSPQGVRKTMGYPDHFEVIAHSLISALLVSKQTRDDVVFYTVMEGAPHAPVTVRFTSNLMESLGGFNEEAVILLFEKALADAGSLTKGDSREVLPGVSLEKISFEALIKDLASRMPLYMLDKKGKDIRQTDLSPILKDRGGFILTDHIPMQKKTYSLMKRLGVKEISLGPVMLFAAHCISIIHNELDRV
jgi:tRNA (pseudouridine54-N1)-methyltransferase